MAAVFFCTCVLLILKVVCGKNKVAYGKREKEADVGFANLICALHAICLRRDINHIVICDMFARWQTRKGGEAWKNI